MLDHEVLEENLNIDDISKEIAKIKKETSTSLDWASILLQSEDGKFNPPTDLPENYYKATCFDFAKTINRIIDKFGLCKSELQKLKPGTCTPLTEALSKRVFIPILHPQDSYLLINGSFYTLEVGKVYLVNTNLPHSIINVSSASRVDLVGRMYS